MKIRVILADDHGILREGIKSLIEQKCSNITVVGEAADGTTAVHLAGELNPDLVLMDVTMPGLNGIEATRQISNRHPGIRILALSVHKKREFIVDILKAGASGYILKECLLDDLIKAVDAVMTGESFLSPKIASVVINKITEEKTSEFSLPITPRESQVLQLLVDGKTAKQIALKLRVSSKTIEANRRQLMQKLGIDNLPELVKYAIREGLTTV